MLQRAGRGREPPDPHHSSVTRACLLLLLSLGSGVAHGGQGVSLLGRVPSWTWGRRPVPPAAAA